MKCHFHKRDLIWTVRRWNRVAKLLVPVIALWLIYFSLMDIFIASTKDYVASPTP